MNTRRFTLAIATGLSLFVLAAASGCRTGSYAERGAVTGGVVGGLTGAVLGGEAGHSPEGALVGTVVGSMIGAAVGDDIDAETAQREALAAQRAAAQNGPRPVSRDEIVAMVQSGVGEQVIVNHIRTHGVAAPLATHDIVALHQDGVSDQIIAAMQQAQVRPPQGAAPVIIHEEVPVPVYYEPHVYHVHRHPRRYPRWGFSIYH